MGRYVSGFATVCKLQKMELRITLSFLYVFCLRKKGQVFIADLHFFIDNNSNPKELINECI